MVYFKTNYIRDANTWMIRKIRPIVFITLGGYFYYHMTLYEYHGRRVIFKSKYLDWRSEEDKKKDADNFRTNFGYKPRYEPKLENSIKKRKYAEQTLLETINDTPRMHTHRKGQMMNDFGYNDPETTNTFYHIVLDHARIPGEFDYTQPQTYHAVFPDTEQAQYVEIGGKNHRKLQITRFSA